MAYVCDGFEVINGLKTCVSWIEHVEQQTGFNLLNITPAEADMLLSQTLLCFATVWVYNIVNDVFNGK